MALGEIPGAAREQVSQVPGPGQAAQDHAHSSLCHGGLLVALIVVLGFAFYVSVVRVFFAQDDFGWLQVARQLDLQGVLRAFTGIGQGLVWRPLSQQAWFAANLALWGPSAEMFHASSLVVHLGNGVLAFMIARRLLADDRWAAVVGAVYVTNPVHFQAVAWPSAFTEVGSSFFMLAAFLAYLIYAEGGPHSRAAILVSLVAFLGGLMCKEVAAALPLVILAHILVVRRVPLMQVLATWRVLGLYFAGAGLYAFRFVLVGVPTRGAYDVALNLASFDNGLRYLVMAAGTTRYLWWRIVGMDIEPVVVRAAGTVLLLALVALAIRLRQVRPVAAFGVAWFVLFISPVLLVPNQVSAYYASLPSLGLGLAVAGAASRVWPQLRLAWMIPVLVPVLLVHSAGVRGEHIANPVPFMGRVAKQTIANLDRSSILKGAETLYLVAVPSVERWAYGFRNMFLVWYPEVRRVAYVERIEDVPPEAWMNPSVAVLSLCGGQVRNLKSGPREIVHCGP